MVLPLLKLAGKKSAMPRRKLFRKGRNLNLLLSEEVVRRLDKVTRDGETRTAVLREAVRLLIERREAERAKKG